MISGEALFVGGSLNSRRLKVDITLSVIRFPKKTNIIPDLRLLPDGSSAPFDMTYYEDDYHRERFAVQNIAFTWYRHSDVSPADAIALLLTNYSAESPADSPPEVSQPKFRPGQRLAHFPAGSRMAHYWVSAFDEETGEYLLHINKHFPFTVVADRETVEKNMIADDSNEPDRQR